MSTITTNLGNFKAGEGLNSGWNLGSNLVQIPSIAA